MFELKDNQHFSEVEENEVTGTLCQDYVGV